MPNAKYQRTGSVLNRKYMCFMISAMLSAVGISLGEFADSMVVSNLLGSDAFAIINLGVPIVLMVSMVYTVTGVGGSLLFAECLGKKDEESANNYFMNSTVLSLLTGIVLLVLLVVFHPVLGDLFGCPKELRTEFDRYIFMLIFFVPVGILLMQLNYFLPVVGKPFLSMGIVVAVNVLNVVLDVVFIREIGMGCTGAAAATLVSYAAMFLFMLCILHFQKLPLKACRLRDPVKTAGRIVKKGFPPGIVQGGYVITTIFCNYFMNLAYGINGVVAMSLFAQLDSVISIALTGIVDNNASFAAMLKGEGDYFGIRGLSWRVTKIIVVVCIILSVLFAVFPEPIAMVFNIHDPGALTLIHDLIWIYVLYYPMRCILLVLRDIYNTLDHSVYAMLLGVLDKVISIPLIGGILYHFFGGAGLIAAFPISMVLILSLIAVINYGMFRKSKGRYSPVLLLDEEYPLKVLYSYSVHSTEDAADIGLYIRNILKHTDVDPGILDKMCLAIEEMSLYITEQCGAETAADYMISSNGRNYILTCRNPGAPFCPVRDDGGERSFNEMLLNGLFQVRHEYIFGLNSTSLTIGVKEI